MEGVHWSERHCGLQTTTGRGGAGGGRDGTQCFLRQESQMSVPFCEAPTRTGLVSRNHPHFTSAFLSVIAFSVFYKGNR